MINAFIGIILTALAAWAGFKVYKRARQGGACCGERETAPARLRAADTNRRHYPYRVTLTIGGMTCENCARRVENALNALPDTLAKVSISTKKATVCTKQPPDTDALRRAVSSAGYSVVGE